MKRNLVIRMVVCGVLLSACQLYAMENNSEAPADVGKRSTHHYPGGQVRLIHHIGKDGSQHGKRTEYFENGKVKMVGNFVHGREDGTFKEFYKSGALKEVITYREGVCHGPYKRFSETGEVLQDTVLENGLSAEGRKLMKEAAKKFEETMKQSIADKSIRKVSPQTESLQKCHGKPVEISIIGSEYLGAHTITPPLLVCSDWHCQAVNVQSMTIVLYTKEAIDLKDRVTIKGIFFRSAGERGDLPSLVVYSWEPEDGKADKSGRDDSKNRKID